MRLALVTIAAAKLYLRTNLSNNVGHLSVRASHRTSRCPRQKELLCSQGVRASSRNEQKPTTIAAAIETEERVWFAWIN